MDTSTAGAFVGRTKEINLFIDALGDARLKTQALYLQAAGGTGKTRLLEAFAAECRGREIPRTRLVDFYETTNQQINSVMQRLADELKQLVALAGGEIGALRPFEKFESQRKELLRARSTNRSSETIATLERQVEKQFLADYNGLMAWFVERGKPVVLFFDTFEVVQDRGQIGFWLLRRLIPIIQNTVVAFAGRRPLPELPDDIAVTVLPIGNFDLAETQLYLHSRDVFLSDVSKFQHIYELTRGSPLLLALVVEWYLVHQDMVELVGDRDDLDSQTQDWFERQLISSVLCLDHPDAYEAVWYMAHVFHRFDAEILAWIRGKSSATDEERTILANVAALSFVKHREYSDSYQLQDEMRNLVTRHILDAVEDQDGQLRRDISEKMVKYYEAAIAAALQQGQESEADILRAEQLYHHFFINPAEGSRQFADLFKEADKSNNISLADLLLSSAQVFYKQMTEEQQLITDVYTGQLAMRRGDYANAETRLLSSLAALERLNHARVDEAAYALGSVYRLQGQYARAMAMYDHALEANKRSTKPRLERERVAAMILNDQGNIYRLEGLVEEAHRRCLGSLVLRKQLGDDLRNIADSCFFLGLILQEIGDITGSLRYFDEANRYYKDKGQLGREGVANVLRRRAYIDVHFNEYDKAIEKAEQSCSIFDKEIGTPSADWADSLDILGRLYRDRGVYEFKCAMQAGLRESELENARARRDEDFSRAEDLIDRGYRMAQEVGDKYKEAESLLSYVRLYHYQEDFQRSLQFYEKGVAICRPLEYHLLLSYFELFAGISYFRMHDYDRTFEHFALRGLYASRCRAMELGMTMDSIGDYLVRLQDPALVAKYADYLISYWQSHASDADGKYNLEGRYPQIIGLCTDIKEYVTK